MLTEETAKAFDVRPLLRGALIGGGFGLVAGVAGPLLFSSSNLGPLLGVLVTGPIGALAGMVWGLMTSARNAQAFQMRPAWLWLLAIWLVGLAYTLLMFELAARLALPAIGVQVLIVGATSRLLRNGDTKRRWPPFRRCGAIIMALMIAVALTSLVPPVTVPMSQGSQRYGTDAPMATFILDRRLDASRHVPLLVVSTRRLTFEWLLLAAVALAGCVVFARQRCLESSGDEHGLY